MSEEEAQPQKARKSANKKSKEKTGYGNPPKSGQFKPGKSGNPTGRPAKPPLTPEQLFHKVLRTSTTLKINGVERQVTYLELAMLQCAQQAASGDKKSFSMILDRLLPKKIDRAGIDDYDDSEVPVGKVSTIKIQTVDARHPIIIAREAAKKAGGRFIDDNEEANKDKWFNKMKIDDE